MVLWNLPDGGPSHSVPLLGPSESYVGWYPRHQSSLAAPECLASE
jgi:hypothetical protein